MMLNYKKHKLGMDLDFWIRMQPYGQRADDRLLELYFTMFLFYKVKI